MDMRVICCQVEVGLCLYGPQECPHAGLHDGSHQCENPHPCLRIGRLNGEHPWVMCARPAEEVSHG